jgi:hypothetical protein
MTSKKATKSATKQLIAELHSSASKVVLDSATKDAIKTETKTTENNTKSATADVKVRDVKVLSQKKTSDELAKSTRAIDNKSFRSYVNVQLDDKTFDSATSSAYYYETEDVNAENKLDFSQKIANEKVELYVNTMQLNSQMTAQVIQKMYRTCGSAYCDKIRNKLYALSVELYDSTLAETCETFEEYTAKLLEKYITSELLSKLTKENKLLVKIDYYRRQARKQRYIFIKVRTQSAS